MQQHKQKNILVIIGSWPSQTHPYLTRLFSELKQAYPNLSLMLFEPSTPDIAFPIIGENRTQELLNAAIYRVTAIRNPFQHIRLWFTCLLHFQHARLVALDCRRQGYNWKQVYGQLFYYREILGKSFELVHINALQTAWHFKTREWFRHAKLLVSSRGQDFDFFPDKYDAILHQTDHVHVLGAYLQQKVIARSIPEEQITIIPPAFEGTEIHGHRMLPKDGTIRIATAARLSWTKGFRYALGAVQELSKKYRIVYDIYGMGEQGAELKFLINQLGLNDIVVLHGWLNEPELKQALTDTHFYLLLSIEEGFNNSVILAQSLGIPCIVSNAGGLPENVVHGVSGYVVPSYDSIAAATAIADLIEQPETYINLSKGALQRVQSLHFSKQVEDYRALYEKLLAC